MSDKVKTYVSLADIHYPKIHKPTLEAVKDFLKQNKVDGLIYQGDQLDMENISHHTKGKPWFRQRQGYMSDINGFRKVVLDPVEDLLKADCKKYWIIGNHERFEQDLVECQPELEGLVNHVKLLELVERGYEIIPLGHALKLGKLNVCHGEILSGIGNQMGTFPAKKAVLLYAGNVLAAHSHAPQMYTQVSPVEHSQKWQGFIAPILGATNPSYLKNRPTGWINGFTIIESHPNGSFNLYLVNVFNGEFSYGGVMYGGKK